MRSSNGRRRQSGQSLVEVVVAVALLGITIVGGLTAIDVSVRGVHRAVHVAWARCVARNEAQMILSSPWDSTGAYGTPQNVTLTPSVTGSGVGQLQRIVVTAVDPDPPHQSLFSITIYKSQLLSSQQPFSTSDFPGNSPEGAVAAQCQGLLGS